MKKDCHCKKYSNRCMVLLKLNGTFQLDFRLAFHSMLCMCHYVILSLSCSILSHIHSHYFFEIYLAFFNVHVHMCQSCVCVCLALLISVHFYYSGWFRVERIVKEYFSSFLSIYTTGNCIPTTKKPKSWKPKRLFEIKRTVQRHDIS